MFQAAQDPVEAFRRQQAIILKIPESQLPIYNYHLEIPPPLPPIRTHPKDLKKRKHSNKKHINN